MIKMLIFDLKESEREFLKNIDTSDYNITCFKECLNDSTKLSMKDFDETSIISVFLTSDISRTVLNKFKNLRIIITRSICYKHIDLDACRERNIAVINADNYGRDSVSQYVTGLIFTLTRNIFSAANNFKKGINYYEKYEGKNINNLSLGVIGTGYIGSAVCELAHSLGMKIYGNDIVINKEICDFTEYVSLTDLLRKSDIITIHLPYSKDCHHLLSFREFSVMKEGSYLINTSQGDFINYIALYRALKNKKLNGAALDIIFENQRDIFENNHTKANYEEMEKIIIRQYLNAMDNVIITPRIAYNTNETLNKIITANFRNIKDYFKGLKTNRVL